MIIEKIEIQKISFEYKLGLTENELSLIKDALEMCTELDGSAEMDENPIASEMFDLRAEIARQLGE